MNPQDQKDNTTPTQPPVAPSQPAAVQPIVAPKRRTGLALLLLIGPSALIVFAIILAAVSNFIFGTADNPVRTIINVFVFLAGAVTILTWLPGIIIGIVLLAKK